MKLKIAILDDHQLVLEGIKNTLKMDKSFSIVAACTIPDDLISLLKDSRLDIVIMDMILKNQHAFDFIPLIQDIEKPPKIILISGFYELLLHKRALELGASAFLRKEVTYDELINTIKSVADGNKVYPEFLYSSNEKTFLTKKETEVLNLVANELTNEKIAKALFISRRTVEAHISTICNKLEVNTRIGAVRKGIMLNLIK